MKTQLFKLLLISCLISYVDFTYGQNAPNAPSNFQAMPNPGENKIYLFWTDNADNETRFVISKEWIDEFDNSQEIIISADSTHYIDASVHPNIDYHYSLWAENEFGPSEEVYTNATIHVEAPPAPDIAVTQGALTSIQVSFVDNSNRESGYQIQHTSDSGLIFMQSFEIPGHALGDLVTASVSGYPHNTTVYVRVRGFAYSNGTKIYGAFSAVKSANTDSLPVNPSNFRDSIDVNKIVLRWNDNANNEAAYILVRYTGSYNPNIHTAFRLPANTNSYADNTVQPGVSYTYRLQAIDVYEDVPARYFFTAGRYVETSAIITPILAAPSDLRGGAIDAHSILFSYTDNSSNEDGFEVHYSVVSPNGPFEIKWLNDEDPDYEINLGGLDGFDANTTVYFKVRAVLFANNYLDTIYSDFSNLAEVTTDDLEPLPAPLAHLATFVSPTSFTANWESVDNAAYYKLYVFTVNDSTPLSGYYGIPVWDISMTVDGTKPSKRYAYYVVAVNSDVTSEPSNTIRVTKIKNLTLRTVCSDNPTVRRRWKVINNNPITVDVWWLVNNTSQAGTHHATTGESYFYTQTVGGNNRITITWEDDEFLDHNSSKTSTWKPCVDDSTARSYEVIAETQNENSPFSIVAYPNRVIDKLHLRVQSETTADVAIEIINLQGERLVKREGKTNTELEFDMSVYTSGIYLVKAQQTKQHASVKIFKE
jgi:hypothetical protein